jgi:regulator of sigma E protease
LDKPQPAPAVSENESELPASKGVGSWLTSNFVPLFVVIAVVALIIWKGLVPGDVLTVVIGLGLVIFIHELGHFVAAKFCDVHVETFSIGFGKALPFCQFRWGETTYKIGWIPLGGYVKMVGEGENADSEEAEEDPRSFKNKSVWQRMVIISAGVVMNLILGCICFMVAYMHGVEETPALVGVVGVGSPAWEEDLRAGDQITQIDDITRPTFDDIRPRVMSTSKGEPVRFHTRGLSGLERDVNLVPRRNPEDLYPLVGINPIEQLTLKKTRRSDLPPARRNSPAAKATTTDGTHFQGADRIVAATDPENPSTVKEIAKDPRDTTGTKLDTLDYMRRQQRLRDQKMTVRVDRAGQQLDFNLEPAFSQVLPGVRFQMGRIAAVRSNGPAAKAKLVSPAGEPGIQVSRPDQPDAGDKIIAIAVQKDGKDLRFVESVEKDGDVVFDPLKLGYELEKWAETATDRTVQVTVLRTASATAKAPTRVVFEMQWDPELVFNGEMVLGASAPMPISGLGLAYYIDTTIDAAPGQGLAKGDVITEVRFREVDEKGAAKPDEWIPLKQYQGAYLHAMIQRAPAPEVDFKVTRAGATDVEVSEVAGPDTSWPAVDRGLSFQLDTRTQKAEGPGEALAMGLHRTWRTVKVIYQTLYATIFRQISAKTMSGPLSIASASYNIAGYDTWQFILFIGLININLAVVNFLPIPLLDGGHMVFLIYEKIRGKPAPERVQAIALYMGLAFILLLMAFVIFLDVRRLFF